MNFDTPTPREEIEAKLTALLLGELPAEQAISLQAAMAKDVELAKLYERLKSTIDLVRETEKSPTGQIAQAPLKLSGDRREKLLARFKTVVPKEFAQPRSRKREWLVPASVAALLLSIGTIWFVQSTGSQFLLMTRVQREEREPLDLTRSKLPGGGKDLGYFSGEKISSNSIEREKEVTRTLNGVSASTTPARRRIEKFGVDSDDKEASARPKAAMQTAGLAERTTPIARNQPSTLFLPQIEIGPGESHSDVNRNGEFDKKDTIPVNGANEPILSSFSGHSYSNAGSIGDAAYSIDPKTRRVVTTSNYIAGDPQWVGILENPGFPHSSSNAFVGRYAYRGLATNYQTLQNGEVDANPPPDFFDNALLGQVKGSELASSAGGGGISMRFKPTAPGATNPKPSQNIEPNGTDANALIVPALVPENKPASLVIEGRQLYESGRLDEAATKLKQEIGKDPQNQAAQYYLNLINEKRNSEAQNRRASRNMTVELEQAWARPPKRELLPVPNPYARSTANKSVGTKGESAETDVSGSDLYLGNKLAHKLSESRQKENMAGRSSNPSVAPFDTPAAKSSDRASNFYSLGVVGYINVPFTNGIVANQEGVELAKNEWSQISATLRGLYDDNVGTGPIVDQLASKKSEFDVGLQRERQLSLSERPQVSEASGGTSRGRSELGERRLVEPTQAPAPTTPIALPHAADDISGLALNQTETTALKERVNKKQAEIQLAQKQVQGLSQQLHSPKAVANFDSPAMLMSQDTLRKIEALRDERKTDLARGETMVNSLKKLSRGEPSALPTAVQDPQINALFETRTVAELSLVTKTNAFGPESEQVQKLKGQIADLNGQIDKRVAELETKIATEAKSLQDLDAEIKGARENEAQDEEKRRSRPNPTGPIPQPEVRTEANPYSTFSLNVSDVSFKLAAASLEKGQMPEPASIRSEEFINAFDYRDLEPAPDAPIGFAWERARYPFAQNRDLLRFSIKTAAAGRQAGRPLNIVLLLDNSGSMERADRVNIIREALRVLASQLQAQDKLSVVTFARTPRLWVDGVAGDKAGNVADELSGLTPEGGTNLEEAMNLAYQTAAGHYLPNGVNRVVLLTDGAANLGDVAPESLKQKVEAQRKQGIALDCFGIGWEGFNDGLLETLSRNGDGRYGFINTPEEASTEFAGQLAGALRVAASDVKVQIEFNPKRVLAYRQIGYAKHQLTKEQFRDNTVDAAEIGAAESGNALYVIEVNQGGEGPLGIVRVRFKVPGTSDYREHEWAVPFNGNAVSLEQSPPTMRLAATASAFSEWLASSPYAGEVTPDSLLGYLGGVADVYGADARPKKLEWMIRQAKSLAGK